PRAWPFRLLNGLAEDFPIRFPAPKPDIQSCTDVSNKKAALLTHADEITLQNNQSVVFHPSELVISTLQETGIQAIRIQFGESPAHQIEDISAQPFVFLTEVVSVDQRKLTGNHPFLVSFHHFFILRHGLP